MEQAHYNLRGKSFEDMKVGDTFTTDGRTVTETDILMYSSLVGDFSFLHTNDELAKRSAFGTRIPQGLLTFAISEGLILRGGIFDSIDSAQFVDLHDLKFSKEVKPGDTIQVKFVITNKKKIDVPGYGQITLKRTVMNQAGEVALTAETSGMMATREKGMS